MNELNGEKKNYTSLQNKHIWNATDHSDMLEF